MHKCDRQTTDDGERYGEIGKYRQNRLS